MPLQRSGTRPACRWRRQVRDRLFESALRRPLIAVLYNSPEQTARMEI